MEIGDGLAAVRFRAQALEVIEILQRSSAVEVVPVSPPLFQAALDLYANRGDKDWGLTDCSSFIVMRDRGLTDALTADEHFQQAGFRAVLLENAVS